MPTRFQFRRYQRFEIRCPLHYLGNAFLGKGRVLDLSLDGWRAEGDHPVKLGTTIALRMTLSDQADPLDVDLALVQWVRGREFGLQIVKLSLLSKARLTRFTRSLAKQTHSAPSPITASR